MFLFTIVFVFLDLSPFELVTLLGLVVVTVLFLFFLNFLSLNLRGDLIGMLRLLKAVKGLLVFVAVLITPSGGRLGT